MDPSRPPNISDMKGVYWLGRGRGLQFEEMAIGQSRGLLFPIEAPGVVQTRSFPPSDANSPGQEVTPLPTELGVGEAKGLFVKPYDFTGGRARGFLLPPAEPKAGMARGGVLQTLEPQPERQPPETVTLETSGSDAAMVRAEDVHI